jgi:hypothetical protein
MSRKAVRVLLHTFNKFNINFASKYFIWLLNFSIQLKKNLSVLLKFLYKKCWQYLKSCYKSFIEKWFHGMRIFSYVNWVHKRSDIYILDKTIAIESIIFNIEFWRINHVNLQWSKSWVPKSNHLKHTFLIKAISHPCVKQ